MPVFKGSQPIGRFLLWLFCFAQYMAVSPPGPPAGIEFSIWMFGMSWKRPWCYLPLLISLSPRGPFWAVCYHTWRNSCPSFHLGNDLPSGRTLKHWKHSLAGVPKDPLEGQNKLSSPSLTQPQISSSGSGMLSDPRPWFLITFILI